MKKNILVILKTLFVVLMIGFVLFHQARKPRIMVMHSYHTDYPWVIQINEGVRRVLQKHQDITVRYHYMDLKNHTDADFKRTAAESANLTISKWQPDILILADDIAQKLVGMKYPDHPSMKIVFNGVNGGVSDYGYDKAKNVTGILERKPLAAIKETLVMIAKARGFGFDDQKEKKPKVVFLCDTSGSVTAELPELNAFDWKPLEWLPPVRVDNFKEWKKAVEDINQYADLIVVSDYREFRLPSGEKEPVAPSEIMKWTEANSKIPVLGMSLINVYDGGMMAVFTSGYEQGEVSGNMALALIKGKPATSVPIESTKQFLIAVRKSSMTNRNLPIPSIYEAFARATDNFYE